MTSVKDASSRERWTVRELLDWTSEKFESIGIDQGRTDAQYLLAYALGCSRMELYLQLDRLLDAEQRGSFRDIVKRRLAREPVAYIEGKRAFHALDLDLLVGPQVLIPRPETEHLVDWAMECLKEIDEPAKVLDVGTGSGAIALAIKRGCVQAEVTAVDVSPEALKIAQENAHRLELDLRFLSSDLLSSLPEDDRFDLICANLPYIPHADLAGLQPEVRDHEPHLALDGGDDGLVLIEKLLDQVVQGERLSKQGSLLLEFGIGQASAVEAMLRKRNFEYVACRKDYGDIERVIRASLSPFAETQDLGAVTLEPDPDPRELAMQEMAKADQESASGD